MSQTFPHGSRPAAMIRKQIELVRALVYGIRH